MDDSKNHIHQRVDEIHQILFKMVGKLGDELGVAFGIVMEVSDKPEELPSWTIRIDESKVTLTSAVLLDYMSEHTTMKDALARFMCDRFPAFVSFFPL